MVFTGFIGLVLIYLAIRKQYEPLLLLPIGFGILVANLPLTHLMEPGEGLLWRFYHYGIEWEVIPPLIFLGLGAHTDFGPLLSQPRLIFLGGGGAGRCLRDVFCRARHGFFVERSGDDRDHRGRGWSHDHFSRGADSASAPRRLRGGGVFVYGARSDHSAAYHACFDHGKRAKDPDEEVPQGAAAGKALVFRFVATIVIVLLVPQSAALISMFMLGNLFRESKVVDRLTDTVQNSLMNIVTIFLGISVGATMSAETFLRSDVIFIFFLGLFAFMIGTATGILLAKLMNLFTEDKINPLVGAAGVSAVPMAARVVHKMGAEADKKNYLLMFAMGPNLAGVIGTVIAAGIFLTIFK